MDQHTVRGLSGHEAGKGDAVRADERLGQALVIAGEQRVAQAKVRSASRERRRRSRGQQDEAALGRGLLDLLQGDPMLPHGGRCLLSSEQPWST